MREYERISTTVANAYVQPLMAGYLAPPRATASPPTGFECPLYLMTSGGGADHARDGARASRSGWSSPARPAAPSSPPTSRAERGERKVLSFDMGGTTAKICLIEDCDAADRRAPSRSTARPRFLQGQRPAGPHPGDRDGRDRRRRRLDRARRRHGPHHRRAGQRRLRARARPATAAAATRPTVTDADLVLGTIDPGALRRRHDRARPGQARGGARARRRRAAVGCRPRSAASASARSSTRTWPTPPASTPSSAARTIGDHTLIAFGGAAPLHAARLAREARHRRASWCRPMPASARRSASCARRSPTRWCAAATCGSTASTLPRSTGCSPAMRRRRGASPRRGAAGEAGRDAASPSCAISGRATRSWCRCRRGRCRRRRGRSMRDRLREGIRPALRALHPQRRDRGAELRPSTVGTAPARPEVCPRRSARPGPAPIGARAVVDGRSDDTPHPRCRSTPAPTSRRARPSPVPPSSSRKAPPPS